MVKLPNLSPKLNFLRQNDLQLLENLLDENFSQIKGSAIFFLKKIFGKFLERFPRSFRSFRWFNKLKTNGRICKNYLLLPGVIEQVGWGSPFSVFSAWVSSVSGGGVLVEGG